MEKNKLDIFSYMTKEMKEVLEVQKELAKDGFSTGDDFAILREEYEKERKFWNEDAPELSKVFDKTIEGPHGDISIRFYCPNEKKINRCAIFIHGGGFVVGSPNTHDRMIRFFAKDSDCLVVAVDYRLAPEYKFPVAIEECARVVEYLRANANEYGVDKDSISLAGDSGGANLCLATTLYLRDREDDISYIKSLLLFYGLFGLKDSPARRVLGGTWDGLTKEDLEYYESCYLRNEEDKTHPYYDCLNADLSYNIPPTYLAIADLDPLMDDSYALEKILKEHKVPCEVETYKGMLHAFLHYTKLIPEANEAIKSAANFLNRY